MFGLKDDTFRTSPLQPFERYGQGLIGGPEVIGERVPYLANTAFYRATAGSKTSVKRFVVHSVSLIFLRKEKHF